MSELPFSENNENRTIIPPVPAPPTPTPPADEDPARAATPPASASEGAARQVAPEAQAEPARQLEAEAQAEPAHHVKPEAPAMPAVPEALQAQTRENVATASLTEAAHNTPMDPIAAPWPAPAPESRWTGEETTTSDASAASSVARSTTQPPAESASREVPQRPLPPAFPNATPAAAATAAPASSSAPASASVPTPASAQTSANAPSPFTAPAVPAATAMTPPASTPTPAPPTAPPAPASSFARSDQPATPRPQDSRPTPAPPPAFPAPMPPQHGHTSKRQGVGLGTLLLAMLLTAALSMGGMYGLWKYFGPRNMATAPASSQSPAPAPAAAAPAGDSIDWQAIAASVSPTVVTINVAAPTESGVGSGVIYAADGTIVTNHHVIMPAVNNQGRIQVTLKDGRLYQATIVGTDPSTDLAVIRLTNPPADLAVAQFGSSANLTVGSHVMAIGSPLGLSNTVTTGIISALDRPVAVQAKSQPQYDPNDPFGQLDPNANATESVVTNAIQVDASINPGNSGGPLFDAAGSVIGINSSIASLAQNSSDTAGSIGLGFAIPVDLVRSVADQLIQTGTVAHAILGVNIATAAVESDGNTYVSARIESLVPGGAAEQAGLRVGDAITHVNGSMVTSARSLSGFIRRYSAGDTVTITYIRDGKSTEVEVTLQAK
ncbi:trypsin-like peptidase domain-containing protein [Schaalia canis]|nr:trypsin-like peptidase domain-containing protein [Schaalia canis]